MSTESVLNHHYTHIFFNHGLFYSNYMGNEARNRTPLAKSTDYMFWLGMLPGLADLLFIQGKVAELRLELNSGGKKDKNHSAKKIALKKIVANMTMSNNDMVALFPDVVGCMQIPSLEIKKMYA